MYRLTLVGFLGRWAFATVLVLATFNPSGWSYVGWISAGDDSLPGVKLMIGLVLVLLLVLYYQATRRSIGEYGAGALLVMFAAAIWQLADWGWIDLDNMQLLTWLGLVFMAFVMAIGMSWQHIQNRLTGQFDIEDD